MDVYRAVSFYLIANISPKLVLTPLWTWPIIYCYCLIFSRQASLARQAFLITALHGARYKTGKNAYAKK